MYKFEFHQVTYVLDSLVRKSSKVWSKLSREADAADDNELRKKTLINVFHYIRTAALLLHPLAPEGTELSLIHIYRMNLSCLSLKITVPSTKNSAA